MDVAFGLTWCFWQGLDSRDCCFCEKKCILYLEMYLYAEKLFLVSVMWGNKNKAVANNFSGKYLRIDFNSWNVKQKLLA